MAVASIPLSRLDTRRRELGMTIDTLAKKASVSTATAKRVLRGDCNSVSFGAVTSLADALGVSFGLEETPVEEMIERQATLKARRLASMVQGTSALEDQGLDADDFNELVRRSKRRVLAGSHRRLWEEV
ncbi:MAG TPA: helix-turn-helix domain-containing protein [Pirellulales bacterium]